MKREDINIRDPFVFVHDGKYYLYGTRGATCWGEADGFDCYVGTDLEQIEGPFVPHSDGSVTPKEWASLDGTLYVEPDGTPHMVFCHEWADTDGNGTFSGIWKPERELLFAKDGGHGMLFTGLDGKRYLALHSPNDSLLERPKFIEVNI